MAVRRGAVVLAVGMLTPIALLSRPATAAEPLLFPTLGGSLTITVPSATATLTSGGSNPVASLNGETVGGQIGSTTVTDTTSTVAHIDTVTMSFAFTGGPSTIPASDVTGYSGPTTATSGLLTAVILPTTTAQPLAGAGSAIIKATGVISLSFSFTYNPTVTVTIPGSAVAGTYSGTVTQTVSSS